MAVHILQDSFKTNTDNLSCKKLLQEQESWIIKHNIPLEPPCNAEGQFNPKKAHEQQATDLPRTDLGWKLS